MSCLQRCYFKCTPSQLYITAGDGPPNISKAETTGQGESGTSMAICGLPSRLVGNLWSGQAIPLATLKGLAQQIGIKPYLRSFPQIIQKREMF